MNIFPVNPTLTPEHRKRLAPHLGNVRTTLKPWLKTNPSTDDLKRAAMLEVQGAKADCFPMAKIRRGVLDLLLKQIARNERGDIDTRILKILKP
jgi:hypothetical protein